MPLNYLIQWSEHYYPDDYQGNPMYLTWKIPLSWRLFSEKFMHRDAFYSSPFLPGELTYHRMSNHIRCIQVSFGNYAFSKGNLDGVNEWLTHSSIQELQTLLKQSALWAPWTALQKDCFKIIQGHLSPAKIQALNWSEILAEFETQEQELRFSLQEKCDLESWYLKKSIPETSVFSIKSRI